MLASLRLYLGIFFQIYGLHVKVSLSSLRLFHNKLAYQLTPLLCKQNVPDEHWRSFLRKFRNLIRHSANESIHPICFGHFGQNDICVMLPKVIKASRATVIAVGIIPKNLANVNTTFWHFLSHCTSGKNHTLDLGIISRVLNHCASGTQLCRQHIDKSPKAKKFSHQKLLPNKLNYNCLLFKPRVRHKTILFGKLRKVEPLSLRWKLYWKNFA